MNFIYFILFSLIVFSLSLIAYKKFMSTTLYALAIGGIVNANFFHAGNYPINCFGLPFGIDSIIYSLFAFCVVIMFLKTNKHEAYVLSFSSIIAIMFSACMQLVANLFTHGSTAAVWKTFATFSISAAASVIAICIMIEILSKLKDKNINQYVFVLIGMLIITIINSIVYYPLATLINGTPSNIWTLLLTSLIGKIIAIGCGLLTLFFISKIENHSNQKENA